MDRVVVGVRRQGQPVEIDIEVPADLGAAELAERLAHAVGEPAGDGPLELRAVSLGRALRPQETLADAGLWDGALVVLARSSDPVDFGRRGGGALALASETTPLTVIPMPDPPELALAVFAPPPRTVLPLIVAALVGLAMLTAGGVWFLRSRQDTSAIVAAAPTSVSGESAQTQSEATVTVAERAPNAGTGPTAGQAQAPPDEEAAWRTLLTQLDSVWGVDWPASIALLQSFHGQYPTRTAATDKLYSALVEYGRALRDAGATSASADAFDQAVRLQPQRFEAREELAALAPSPTVVTEPPSAAVTQPQSTSTPRPAPPVAAPAPPPTPQPPAEEAGVSCDVADRDIACPLSDGARVENTIGVPDGRHFYWFGVPTPNLQLHVAIDGAACVCVLYVFSDEVDAGQTPIASATGVLDLSMSQPGPYLLELVPDQSGSAAEAPYTLSFALQMPAAPEAADEGAAAATEAPVLVGVPPVVAHSSLEAADRVRAAGLVPQFQTVHQYSPSGAGTIAAQDPAAGTSVPVGSTVTLGVASGDVAVPAVVGLAEQDAWAALKQAGFDVQLRRARRSNVVAGQAGSTDPPAGAIVPAGTIVTLTISQGA